MKIAFVLPDLGGGGAERVALSLISGMIAAGHEVDLVLCEAEGELLALLPDGVRTFDLESPRFRDALFPLAAYFRERRPDAVQASMWPLTSITVLANRLSGSSARLVLSEHVAISRECRSLNWGKRLLARLSIRLSYPMAHARVAVSEGVARDLARFGGIAREHISVIQNPVDIPDVISSIPEAEQLWGETGPRILTIGRLAPQKNQRLLLEALARCGNPDARLMILGEGFLRDELQAAAQSLGISGRVIMPGFKIDPWPFYASADLFVLSSDHEGLPVVLIEALGARLPVISTDCPSGPAEILGGGAFGTLVPCGDAEALAQAIDAALDQSHCRRDESSRAADFSPERATDAYLGLLLGSAGRQHNHGDESIAEA